MEVAAPVSKRCSLCSVVKSVSDFPKSKRHKSGLHPQCKPCKNSESLRYNAQPHVAERVRARKKQWKLLNPDKVRADVRLRIVQRYGLTPAEYDAMHIKQQGMCAICRRPETDRGKSGAPRHLAVDHDHSTQTVRELLCRKCNTVIGLMGESTERLLAMVLYLTKHGAK